MKILSCGDIHFTNYTMYNKPIADKPESGTRLEDILTAFDMFAKYGYDHGIHTYMLNGDIFDSRQKDNPSTIAYVKERIYNAFNSQDVDTTVYINVGNHDECGRDINPNSVSDFKLFSNKHHKFIVMEDAVNLIDFCDGTQALVVPYTEFVEEQKKEIINTKLAKPTVVFAHLGVNGATQGRWNHRLGGAYNLDDLKYNDLNVKGVVLSHYHSRQFLQKAPKPAWYIGDLVALNFNDISESGEASPRGFDVIDTETGEQEFINLHDAPYNIPGFAQYDANSFAENNSHDYIKIVTDNIDDYNRLAESYHDDINIQIVYVPKSIDFVENADTEVTASDKELVKNYCDKYYPDTTDLALQYLAKASEV